MAPIATGFAVRANCIFGTDREQHRGMSTEKKKSNGLRITQVKRSATTSPACEACEPCKRRETDHPWHAPRCQLQPFFLHALYDLISLPYLFLHGLSGSPCLRHFDRCHSQSCFLSQNFLNLMPLPLPFVHFMYFLLDPPPQAQQPSKGESPPGAVLSAQNWFDGSQGSPQVEQGPWFS